MLFCSVLQCVCSVFAVCCSVLKGGHSLELCCVYNLHVNGVLQCVAVRCDVLQYVEFFCSLLQCLIHRAFRLVQVAMKYFKLWCLYILDGIAS